MVLRNLLPAIPVATTGDQDCREIESDRPAPGERTVTGDIQANKPAETQGHGDNHHGQSGELCRQRRGHGGEAGHKGRLMQLREEIGRED